MKQSTKKLVVLLLVAALALSIVACGPANPSVGTDPGNVETPIKEVKFPLEEEVTLSFMVVNYNGKDLEKELAKNELWQELYEKTNVKIELVELPASETLNTINAKFMANQEGDMMLCPPALIPATDFSKMVEDGLFMDISRYVDSEKLMPNLNSRVFADNEQIRAMINSVDGGAYFLPISTGNISTKVENVFWINNTWLKKMGKDVKDIKTIDDLEAVLTYFKNNDMNGNGQADEIPYLVHDRDNNSHLDAFLSLYGIGTKWNKSSTAENGIYIESGEVKFAYTSENYKDAVKKLSDWYAKGLIYEEAFTVSDATYNTLQKGNQIGLSSRAIPGSGTTDEWVALAPVTGTGYDASFFVNPAVVSPTRMAAITRSCEEPEIALAWLDLFYDFETSLRVQYGEKEDGRWTITADGKYEAKWLDDATEKKLQEEQPTLHNLFQMLSGFNNDDYANKFVTTEKDAIRAAAYQMYKDAGALNEEIWPRPAMSGDVASGIEELKQDIFNTMATKRAAWITGKADIDAEWDQYIKDMNTMQIDRYVDLHQEAYDDFLAQFGK